MAAGGHFGCPKIIFDRISGHFRSIRNFYYYYFFDILDGTTMSIIESFKSYRADNEIVTRRTRRRRRCWRKHNIPGNLRFSGI